MVININDLKLYYDKSGEGSPLLFLHGNQEDHHIFTDLTQKLKKDYTTYALDTRHHGKSSSVGGYHYDLFADDVQNFISKLQIEPLSIIGFSDGAIIALILALRNKIKINKLVLLGPNLSPRDFNSEAYACIQNEYTETQNPLTYLMLTEPNIKVEELKKIKIPTWLVRGENDAFKEGVYEQIAAALPHCEYSILQGEDHSSYIIETALIYPKLIQFLKKELPKD